MRRTVGGVILVQRVSGTNQTTRREYLLTDAQGSTYAVLDDYGMPVNASARMSFDPFGQRRIAIGQQAWEAPMPWSIALRDELKDTTRKGYTGHEQVDAVGIIHMGGRIYDPTIGRFLQADPFIQSPGNSQSLNRYSYVFNNPMAWTDPTGYWGAKEQAGLRTVVAIVIACFTGGAAGSAVQAGNLGQAAAISFAGGFAAGAVQSGNLRGAVVGGISGLAFYGIGQKFSVKGVNIASGEGMAAYGKLALVSGATGGVMAELQGGRFGNGFITAGAGAVLAPIPEAASSNPGMQTVMAAVVGGTISELSGGKFANGAVTGAFQFAVGRALASSTGSDSNPIGEEGARFSGAPYYIPDYSAPIVPITFSGSQVPGFGATMMSASADYFASIGIRVQFLEVQPGTKGALVVSVGAGAPSLIPQRVPSVTTYSSRLFGGLRVEGIMLNASSSSPEYSFAHEFAHASGLVDRYVKGVGPNAGYEGNLMGRFGGRSIYRQQINTINSNLEGGWRPNMRFRDEPF